MVKFPLYLIILCLTLMYLLVIILFLSFLQQIVSLAATSWTLLPAFPVCWHWTSTGLIHDRYDLQAWSLTIKPRGLPRLFLALTFLQHLILQTTLFLQGNCMYTLVTQKCIKFLIKWNIKIFSEFLNTLYIWLKTRHFLHVNIIYIF